MEHMLFSDSIQYNTEKKRQTSDGLFNNAVQGSFDPSNSEDETNTNLFSIASKFPTDSNLPASCLLKDDELDNEGTFPTGSVDLKEEQLK